MVPDPTRLQRAISRNIAESSNAILKRRAIVGLHSAHSAHGLDFFRIAEHALFNDMLAHAMRVLDLSGGAASFWYVYRCCDKEIDAFATANNISIERIKELAKRLKCVRDKTHFHIDRHAVLNPTAVWAAAGVTGDDLGWLLESTFACLAEASAVNCGFRPEVPDYDGTDAARIIRAYKAQHPDASVVVLQVHEADRYG